LGGAPLLFPNIPIKSSMPPAPLDPGGLATLFGVPASPSSPDALPMGAFCIDAGAAPSKSMSSRFSAVFCICCVLPPDTAAETAAAAIGFSRAFCFASSMAAACNAELLPLPRKLWGGFW